MKKIILSGMALLSAIAMTGQSKNLQDKVLFTVDDDTVTAGEYIAVYNKNRNLGEDIDPKTPREYLDLYINFKLKVHEAREMGMDTLPSFVREYNSYRNQLAKPYLSDKDVTKELMKEAYERLQQDVRASHILVLFPDNATPDDTAAAYKKINSILAKIENGGDFEKLAEQYSEDTYSAKRGGDLGYFTAFNMVYPFEDAAYRGEIGEITGPVRSRFGYHLVKTTDKRPARGEISVSHIMLVANDESSAEEIANAEKKINELYQQLQEGADFETLARQHSEDKNSARMGGRLQPFGINKMFPQFEEAAFSLEESGDYTAPVRTPVGFHIIRLDKAYEVQPYKEMEPMLRRRVENDMRSQQSKISIVKKLKKEYDFREYPKVLSQVFAQVDESYLEGKYQGADKLKNGNAVLFEFGNVQRTAADFARKLERDKPKPKLSLRTALEEAYQDYTEAQILDYEKSRLEEKYPDFRLLSREYFEGILLFDLTEDKVWRKSVEDTVGLHAYFEQHREQYLWKERYDAIVIDAASAKLAKKAKKMLAKGAGVQEVETALNENSQLNVALDSNRYEAGSNELIDQLEKETGFSKTISKDGRYIIVKIENIVPAGQKSFDEARGAIISDYQNYLEKEWIAELKKEYDIIINEPVLENTIDLLESES